MGVHRQSGIGREHKMGWVQAPEGWQSGDLGARSSHQDTWCTAMGGRLLLFRVGKEHEEHVLGRGCS